MRYIQGSCGCRDLRRQVAAARHTDRFQQQKGRPSSPGASSGCPAPRFPAAKHAAFPMYGRGPRRAGPTPWRRSLRSAATPRTTPPRQVDHGTRSVASPRFVATWRCASGRGRAGRRSRSASVRPGSKGGRSGAAVLEHIDQGVRLERFDHAFEVRVNASHRVEHESPSSSVSARAVNRANRSEARVRPPAPRPPARQRLPRDWRACARGNVCGHAHRRLPRGSAAAQRQRAARRRVGPSCGRPHGSSGARPLRGVRHPRTDRGAAGRSCDGGRHQPAGGRLRAANARLNRLALEVLVATCSSRCGGGASTSSSPTRRTSPRRAATRRAARRVRGTQGPTAVFIDRICDRAAAHLRPGGRVLLVQSSLARPEQTQRRLAEHGFEPAIVAEHAGRLGPVAYGRLDYLARSASPTSRLSSVWLSSRAACPDPSPWA